MNTKTISADDFYISGPENITIKKNVDGTYNLYALICTQHQENGKTVKALTCLKSNGLHFNRDMSFDLSFEIDYRDVYGALGRRVESICMSKQILYNLQFSKNAINGKDTLCEFEILNKGDGVMNYNVLEDLEYYFIDVNVVGFAKNEIKIIAESEIIKIKAQPFTSERWDVECIYEGFKKVESECEIFLPNVGIQTINSDGSIVSNISAHLEDGILSLKIPKINKGVMVEIN